MTREDDDEEMGRSNDFDDDFSFDDDHGYDCDCPDCEYERHQSECGELPEHLGGGCNMSGTEHCDFDCPFRDQVFGMTEDEDE
jgi:hypothetical protein